MPRDPIDPAHSADVTTVEPALHCAECGTQVTRPAWAIAPGDQHERTFFNPYGALFRVVCFREAPGVSDATPPSAEFSWFPGYAWSITVCRGCGEHLGWRYTATDGAEPPVFFGLIKPKLVAGPVHRTR